ncbi:hypothetical protein B0T18DRAFT_385887 [Schizothecium vesticola]|uniref:Uncharacterized protein n=1 Tax=Schizothecium vesticola TaxID=314040 RepID=A0AA40KCH9_9PEZI|nr:hypothetical protein B0T18DRAFT_385887 [Schizothecium vesticola]
MAFQVPQISQDEMLSFQQAHFNPPAISRFGTDFFSRANVLTAVADEAAAVAQAEGKYYDEYDYYDEGNFSEEYYEDDDDDDDDGLGYYPDGVKRTLTDEQIAIFRHSELEKLRRAKEAEEARASRKRTAAEASSPAATADAPAAEEGEIPDNVSEEGEVEGPAPKKRKKNRRKKARTRVDGVVVDLRKRTWDVVDTGLETLDYEEDEGCGGVSGALLKRRRVAYDD